MAGALTPGASTARLIDYLKLRGEYDNTLIVFLSDNGAAGEDHTQSYSPGDAHTDNSLANLGCKGFNVSYGYHWAEVSSTLLSLVKGTSAEGGISVPVIVDLPAALGGARGKVLHGYDLAPTFLTAAAAAAAAGGRRRVPVNHWAVAAAITARAGIGPCAAGWRRAVRSALRPRGKLEAGLRLRPGRPPT